MSRFKITAVALAALFIAGGSQTAFAENPTEAPIQGTVESRPSNSRESEKTGLRILTLEQCIGLALTNNPGLQIERERIIELENDYRIASSGLYPKVTASAYYSKVNRDRVGIQPLMQYTEESLGLLKLKQLLYDGGKTSYNSSAALKAEEAQRESTEAVKLDTVFAVSQAYYQVLEARELVHVGETSKAQREAFFNLTDSYYKAGKATRVEALRAEAQLFDADRSLVQAHEALRLSLLILKKAIGIGVQAQVDVADGLPETFTQPGDEEALLESAMENNPDLKKIAIQKEQARLSLESAQGSFLPELSLQGNYGYRQRDSGMPPLSGDEWMAGVFLEWSLFEGGVTKAQVGKARARINETNWNERAIIDQVQVDLHQAIGDIHTAIAEINSSRKLVDAQDEAYKEVVAFYQRGKATYIEVLTAETDLTQARAAYVRAVGDYQSATVRLDRVIGKRYEINENQGGVP